MLQAAFKNWISLRFGNSVRFDEPMSRHTWFKIGGPADALINPETRDDLIELVKGCTERKIPFMVVGNGSNLLVKDGGIRGVVMVTDKCLDQITGVDSTGENIRICAAAGVKLQTLCRYAIDNGLGGLLFALGIPGTVGGAIAMNAGTREGAMDTVIETVTLLRPSGETEIVSKDRLAFSYRSLLIESENGSGFRVPEVVISAIFKLYPADRGGGGGGRIENEGSNAAQRQAGLPAVGCKGTGMLFQKSGIRPAGRPVD